MDDEYLTKFKAYSQRRLRNSKRWGLKYTFHKKMVKAHEDFVATQIDSFRSLSQETSRHFSDHYKEYWGDYYEEEFNRALEAEKRIFSDKSAELLRKLHADYRNKIEDCERAYKRSFENEMEYSKLSDLLVITQDQLSEALEKIKILEAKLSGGIGE